MQTQPQDVAIAFVFSHLELKKGEGEFYKLTIFNRNPLLFSDLHGRGCPGGAGEGAQRAYRGRSNSTTILFEFSS